MPFAIWAAGLHPNTQCIMSKNLKEVCVSDLFSPRVLDVSDHQERVLQILKWQKHFQSQPAFIHMACVTISFLYQVPSVSMPLG